MTDRETLIRVLESAESAIYWNSSDKSFVEKVADHLIANNFVPVVRCQDCKHSQPISDTEPIYACCCPEVYGIGSRGAIVCHSTHYCGYGERKEDAE